MFTDVIERALLAQAPPFMPQRLRGVGVFLVGVLRALAQPVVILAHHGVMVKGGNEQGRPGRRRAAGALGGWARNEGWDTCGCAAVARPWSVPPPVVRMPLLRQVAAALALAAAAGSAERKPTRGHSRGGASGSGRGVRRLARYSSWSATTSDITTSARSTTARRSPPRLTG